MKIKSIKFLGTKRTFSPEMDGTQHNYLTDQSHAVHRNSHSAAYCLVAYRCLWLKAHFAAEWWTSVMQTCGRDKLVRYMNAARSEGIKLGNIDINDLLPNFDTKGGEKGEETITVGGTIRPGMVSIKGIKSVASKFCGKGEYDNIVDFVKDKGKSKLVMERLIKLGAFSHLPGHENAQALWMWYLYRHGTGKEITDLKKSINTKLLDHLGWDEKAIAAEQERQTAEYRKTFPKKTKLPKKITDWVPKPTATLENMNDLYPDYTVNEYLKFEEEYLGYTIRSPLEIFKTGENKSIEDAKENGVVEAVVTKSEYSYTKTGKKMCRLTISDGLQSSLLILWEDSISKQDKALLRKGAGIYALVDYSKKFGTFSLSRGAYLKALVKREHATTIETGDQV